MITHIPFYAELIGLDVGGTKAVHSHVLIYGAIQFHADGPKGCIASNKTMSKETGYSEQTVANIISILAKAGWIKVNLTEQNRRVTIIPLISLNVPSLQREGGYSGEEAQLTVDGNINNILKDSKKDNTKPSRKKAAIILKNESTDVNSLVMYFYSKLSPATPIPRQMAASNRTSMDSLLSTYNIRDIRDTIDKAKEMLGKPYKPQVQSIQSLLSKFEAIKADKKISINQPTTKF